MKGHQGPGEALARQQQLADLAAEAHAAATSQQAGTAWAHEASLHPEWGAESAPLDPRDREELMRMLTTEREAAETSAAIEADYLREWEAMQAGLEGEVLSGRGARPMGPQRPTEYVFQRDNPFAESSNPFQEGVALYGAGKLAEAALAFEAALQKNPVDSNCWRLLGTCFAENDDDSAAIGPLIKAVDVDPTNLEALLELGVSFTNELAEGQALHYLHEWLKHHPEYQHVPGDVPIDKEHMLTIFLRASEFAPNDSDVFAVLGVLYNLSREFDKAETAFRRACELDPSNYSLWNKLGATQANSSDPDGAAKAVLAYRKALELKPNYVRAWTNMGISFSNQGNYVRAATFYLKALSLNEGSTHVWGYLRFCLACMGRNDLVGKTDGCRVDAFREHFTF